MIYYYEIKRGIKNPGIYTSIGVNVIIKIMQYADRVWCESGQGQIYYVKNRHCCPGTSAYNVDLKEFLWIKLQAQNYAIQPR